MDEINEGVGNPFDTPVPGQSLTDTPGNYPWEHPPQFTDPAEVAEFLWQTLHQEQFLEQTIGMLDAGVPVEAIARVLLFGGFMEGKFSPDVAFIITEPLMKMILSIGVKANVDNIRISMQDITNNETYCNCRSFYLVYNSLYYRTMGISYILCFIITCVINSYNFIFIN